MKISFSTLACPAWDLDAVLETAERLGFDGVELRFIEDDDRLWRRPEFSGRRLAETRSRLAAANLRVSCLDTGCFFHSPEPDKRREAMEMGRAMTELAAALGAPGIRVFGDRVQPGADRASTVVWIADSIRELAAFSRPSGVEVWLESHGDFARGADTLEILWKAGAANTGAVWDPVNAFSEFDESPREGLAVLSSHIRHIHIKDAIPPNSPAVGKLWEPVLMGTGRFPAQDLLRLLVRSDYEGFVSFEWEKRWHPEIPEPEVALPHFMNWMRSALENSHV